jgi:hypothetical protein
MMAASSPLLVPNLDPNLVWDQVVDVVDNYFAIANEQRVQQLGDMLTEGRIETHPRGASTLLEPWNKDSVNFYERLEATMQSLRRQALVRVVPSEGGYLVDITVVKELETTTRPDNMSVSIATGTNLRNDDSLRRLNNPIIGAEPTTGWIPLGRDVALEQTMLAEVQARLGGFPTGPAMPMSTEMSPPPGMILQPGAMPAPGTLPAQDMWAPPGPLPETLPTVPPQPGPQNF